MWPQISHLSSLSLDLFICTVKLIRARTCQDCRGDDRDDFVKRMAQRSVPCGDSVTLVGIIMAHRAVGEVEGPGPHNSKGAGAGLKRLPLPDSVCPLAPSVAHGEN